MSSSSLLINWSPPPVSEINGVLKEYRVFYRPLREWEGNVMILMFLTTSSSEKLIKSFSMQLLDRNFLHLNYSNEINSSKSILCLKVRLRP